jgi:hypothetical protein
MRDIYVGEKNKEMVRLIGRRLREAAVAADAALPQSIMTGLERLNELESSGDAAGQPQLLQQVIVTGQPVGK